MTAVFVLFLLRAALGLLATLPLVPDSAGAKFFKFCSTAAAFLMTSAAGLLYRRLSLPGTRTGFEAETRTLLAVLLTSLVLTVLYNRAQHFSLSAVQGPLLYSALASGAVFLFLASPAQGRWLVLTTDATSVLLLGAAASAMILGHWYLVVLDLPITALRRLTILLIVALALRTLVITAALVGPLHAGYEAARLVASGLWSSDGVFVWMRVLFGIGGPLCLLWFIWKTVEIRSTQSATGILYVQLFLVLSGELLATYLRIAAGLPL